MTDSASVIYGLRQPGKILLNNQIIHMNILIHEYELFSLMCVCCVFGDVDVIKSTLKSETRTGRILRQHDMYIIRRAVNPRMHCSSSKMAGKAREMLIIITIMSLHVAWDQIFVQIEDALFPLHSLQFCLLSLAILNSVSDVSFDYVNISSPGAQISPALCCWVTVRRRIPWIKILTDK